MISARANTGGFRHVARCFTLTNGTNLQCFIEMLYIRQVLVCEQAPSKPFSAK